MERFTVSLDDDLLAQFDAFMRGRGYGNRSEAVRDIIRAALEQERLKASGPEGDCVACLSYIYDHEQRELARRLTRAQHHHHDLSLSTLHVHLDHETCMEVAILQGPMAQVRHLADSITAETGVRHGSLNMVPVVLRDSADHEHSGAHAHAHGPEGGHSHGHGVPHRHRHARPRT